VSQPKSIPGFATEIVVTLLKIAKLENSDPCMEYESNGDEEAKVVFIKPRKVS
jgi:hypothetical protein